MEKLTLESVKQIFDEKESNWKGDNAFMGLVLLSKYFNIKEKTIVCWAGHDEIKSVDVEEAIEAGVTRSDFEQLATLNWMVDEFDSLACFI